MATDLSFISLEDLTSRFNSLKPLYRKSLEELKKKLLEVNSIYEELTIISEELSNRGENVEEWHQEEQKKIS